MRLAPFEQNITDIGMTRKFTTPFEGSRGTTDAGMMVFAATDTDQMRHRSFHDRRDRFG